MVKSTGSCKPASDDKVVFVGVPEFLPPKQLRDLVQRALQSKGIKTKDCTTNFAKLRWSMASIRKPNWPLSPIVLPRFVPFTLSSYCDNFLPSPPTRPKTTPAILSAPGADNSQFGFLMLAILHLNLAKLVVQSLVLFPLDCSARCTRSRSCFGGEEFRDAHKYYLVI